MWTKSLNVAKGNWWSLSGKWVCPAYLGGLDCAAVIFGWATLLWSRGQGRKCSEDTGPNRPIMNLCWGRQPGRAPRTPLPKYNFLHSERLQPQTGLGLGHQVHDVP